MGKRSDFKRMKADFYETPPEAVDPLIPWLYRYGVKLFTEPCAGRGALIEAIERHEFLCDWAFDIEDYGNPRVHHGDALTVGECRGDAFITNPPWTRAVLHPMIERLSGIAPTWMLLDADWMHTKQAVPMLVHCVQIVSVGRVKWIPGSKMTGKDNACWYLFDQRYSGAPIFYGKGFVP